MCNKVITAYNVCSKVITAYYNVANPVCNKVATAYNADTPVYNVDIIVWNKVIAAYIVAIPVLYQTANLPTVYIHTCMCQACLPSNELGWITLAMLAVQCL